MTARRFGSSCRTAAAALAVAVERERSVVAATGLAVARRKDRRGSALVVLGVAIIVAAAARRASGAAVGAALVLQLALGVVAWMAGSALCRRSERRALDRLVPAFDAGMEAAIAHRRWVVRARWSVLILVGRTEAEGERARRPSLAPLGADRLHALAASELTSGRTPAAVADDLYGRSSKDHFGELRDAAPFLIDWSDLVSSFQWACVVALVACLASAAVAAAFAPLAIVAALLLGAAAMSTALALVERAGVTRRQLLADRWSRNLAMRWAVAPDVDELHARLVAAWTALEVAGLELRHQGSDDDGRPAPAVAAPQLYGDPPQALSSLADGRVLPQSGDVAAGAPAAT